MSEELLTAASSGDLSVLQNIIHKGNKRMLFNKTDKSGCTALHWAAGCGHDDIVSYILDLFCDNNDNDHNTVDSNLSCRQVANLQIQSRKAKGRTPLHYAVRNGHTSTVYLLIKYGADLNIKAKQGVSPLQLGVWQNQLSLCKRLVDHLTEGSSNAHTDDIRSQIVNETNDFDCGLIHWIGLCPRARCMVENRYDDGFSLIPMVQWLISFKNFDLHAQQKQGHTVLHKAAWGGHLLLIKYLYETHHFLDDSPDKAGNYAADLADMGGHTKCAEYLRRECGIARIQSCQVLGVSIEASEAEIRQAYLKKARILHPDRCVTTQKTEDKDTQFHELLAAYEHLYKEEGLGRGQRNPTHSLRLMLNHLKGSSETNHSPSSSSSSCNNFKARLLSVLLEYGSKGMCLSNVKKKWTQVWPLSPFPNHEGFSLLEFVSNEASDVVDVQRDPLHNQIRLKPKIGLEIRAANTS